ncbi:hypothetical protein ACCO45_002013 [Purpureocillium lilacinum]|uniref:Uncharacterized protein n=1 Tax=Purpureocillium lilacinum TaxID=33203 RepID=A0ACC4EB45_PURLI
METHEGSTLIKPPPKDPNKAPIENVLEVTEMAVLGPDIFTNARPQWHPPGARGIYGGSVIAQCLASAQKTVPDHFLVHSCHCYFLLAGSADVPILFHVERVRDGRSFATRTVQARQRGRCIFTTTISFTREGSGGEQQVRHAVPLPDGVEAPSDDWDGEPEYARTGPFQSRKIEVLRARDPRRGPTSARPGSGYARGRHLGLGRPPGAPRGAGLHVGQLLHRHRVARAPPVALPLAPEEVPKLPADVRRQVEQLSEFEGMGSRVEDWVGRPSVGMLVSLDHSIYFHEPLRVRADEWMFTEMESPWSGDGRGVVLQKIFAKDGTLLATCVQEGVVRLKQDGSEKAGKL